MTRQLTVLIANPFAHTTSGNDEVLVRLLSKMDRDRFKFVVVLPGESPYADLYRESGAAVEFIPMSVIKRDLSPKFLMGYFGGFIPTILRFVKLIRRYRVDIVHTNTTQILGAGAAARLTGLPSIYHVHSVSIERPEWVGRLMTWWIRMTADSLLANSRASGDIFLRRGFSPDRLVVLTNPVDLELYDQPEAGLKVREELGIGDEPLVGLVGRISPIKGIEHFIDAAAILAGDFPQARFVVVGGADIPGEFVYLDDLKRRAESKGVADRLHFTGRRVDIPQIMSALDALALTSKSEGFGLVLIEAFAAGVPVVGTGVGGVIEIIDEGQNGFLVPYGDPAAIAQALAKLLSDPERAKEMGRAGRKKVERYYSADRLAKVLEGIYISLSRES